MPSFSEDDAKVLERFLARFGGMDFMRAVNSGLVVLTAQKIADILISIGSYVTPESASFNQEKVFRTFGRPRILSSYFVERTPRFLEVFKGVVEGPHPSTEVYAYELGGMNFEVFPSIVESLQEGAVPLSSIAYPILSLFGSDSEMIGNILSRQERNTFFTYPPHFRTLFAVVVSFPQRGSTRVVIDAFPARENRAWGRTRFFSTTKTPFS